jgi:hypothetical protein
MWISCFARKRMCLDSRGIVQIIHPLDNIIQIYSSGIFPANLLNSVTRTNFRIHKEEL